jgi:hypothetical protein
MNSGWPRRLNRQARVDNLAYVPKGMCLRLNPVNFTQEILAESEFYKVIANVTTPHE